MIYTQLRGGLGNQLFQFGAALRAAKGSLRDITLILDNPASNFKCKLNDLFSENLLPVISEQENLIKLINQGSLIYKINDEKSPLLDTSILDYCDSQKIYYLDGYFQSSNNARFVSEQFKKESNEKNRYTPTQVEKICIHYRHGDYVKLDVQRELGLIDLSYYDKVIEKLIDKNSPIKFYSDDDYIEKIYEGIGRSIEFDSHSNDIDCFYKLLNAEMLVIPNSTFSLMAAYLSKSVKTLVRPNIWSRKWLEDDLTNDTSFESVKIYNRFIKI